MRHAIYIAWFTCIWSWVVTYGPTVPVQLSIVRCPRRGHMHCIHMHSLKWYLQMMWFYALRGMKTEYLHFAFLCIHWSDICRYCWHREVLYKLLWLFKEMRWYWLYRDYWVLYLQVFLILIVILFKMLINWTCGLNILSKQFACWDISSHSCITQCRCLLLIKGSGK
jgi:hypothetical protein